MILVMYNEINFSYRTKTTKNIDAYAYATSDFDQTAIRLLSPHPLIVY